MLRSKLLLLPYALVYQLSMLCLISAADTATEVRSGTADTPLILDQKHHYCLRNVTYYEDVAMNKTRQVKVKPSGNFITNIFRKAKYETQNYVVMERVKRTRLENECCEGYARTDNKTCQPVCQSGCPANAYCRAPNKCQCRRGYEVVRANLTDTYHCNPSCSSGCPHGGWCVTPEVCGCADGYRAVAGTCVQECNKGAEDCDDGLANSSEPTLDESTDATQSDTTDTTDIYTDVDARSSNDGLTDKNDVDDDTADEDSAALFPSTYEEANCNLQPCIGDAVCKLVGSCACAEGFTMHQPAPVNGIEVGAICAPVIDQSELLRDESKSNVFFIVVGVAVMLCVLALLAFKLWRHQRGSLDVKGKADMCCKYDKNSSSSESGNGDII